MANSLLTINMITKEAVRLWRNSNSFLKNVDQQYDESFAQTGAKIGQTLRIRLPNDFTVRSGAAANVQDTTEQNTTLVVATQKGVDVSFSSVDRAMSLDNYSKRILAPMINNLAGAVALDVMTGAEAGISNLVSNVDGGGNIVTPTAATWLAGGASLDINSGPRGNRKLILDPLTQARTVSSLSGLFNPSNDISKQYKTGTMQEALGFDWDMDQTVLKHTAGSFTAGTINGAGQTGLTLITNAITGTLAIGDIITIANVFAVNRVTKQTTGQLRQLVVTAAAASGATQISVYPAIVPAGAGGAQVQYQTVDSSPINGATITLGTPAGVTYRKNFGFIPDAVTMATADLELPKGVHEAARESYDGCSMRMLTAYNVQTDQWITRLDILYGYLWVRPEWAVAVADAL